MTEASIEAAKQAKKMGIRIIIDAGTLREGSLDLISFADVLIASEKFAEAISNTDNYIPESALEKLKELSCADTVIITRGSDGSIGLSQDSIFVQPAFKVDAVDTTGAGDVYHGAYIYGLIREWDTAACMRFASSVSAIKCKNVGVKNSIPTLEDIKKFMDSHEF